MLRQLLDVVGGHFDVVVAEEDPRPTGAAYSDVALDAHRLGLRSNVANREIRELCVVRRGEGAIAGVDDQYLQNGMTGSTQIAKERQQPLRPIAGGDDDAQLHPLTGSITVKRRPTERSQTKPSFGAAKNGDGATRVFAWVGSLPCPPRTVSPRQAMCRR